MEKDAQRSKNRGRRGSIESYTSSLMRDTESQLSSFNSQLSNGKYIEPPTIKRNLKQSQSEFSLMKPPAPVKPKEAFRPKIPSRTLESRAKPSRNSKPTPQPYAKKAFKSPKLKTPSIQSPYEEESSESEELLPPPSSSSDSSTRFPNINKKKNGKF